MFNQGGPKIFKHLQANLGCFISSYVILNRNTNKNASWGDLLSETPSHPYAIQILLPSHLKFVPRDEKQRDQVPHLFGPEFEDEIAAGSMKFVDLPKSLFKIFKIFTIDYRFPSHGGLSIGEMFKKNHRRNKAIKFGFLQRVRYHEVLSNSGRWQHPTPSQKTQKKWTSWGFNWNHHPHFGWVESIELLYCYHGNIYIDLSACWTIHDLWLIFPPMNFQLEDKCHYCPDWLPIGYSHITHIYIYISKQIFPSIPPLKKHTHTMFHGFPMVFPKKNDHVSSLYPPIPHPSTSHIVQGSPARFPFSAHTFDTFFLESFGPFFQMNL